MKKIRCAIYTRKSAEEGLEQEFNSLDAQREACAADGTRTGGLPFHRGHLHCLLTNPLYAGRIRHQRRVYEG